MKISYEKVTNKEEAYTAAKSAITPDLIDRFKVKADINYDDANSVVSAKGKGFDLSIQFYETECEVKLDLSFMLKPLRSKIEEGIQKQVKRIV
tara:strand:+ start:106173 stop:106451 length:279 start_codon:yes stop_codon:yes gene_type:complete